MSVSRGSGVHDAGGGGAGAGPLVIVVHAQVVAQFVSHDGGERRQVVVGELQETDGRQPSPSGQSEGRRGVGGAYRVDPAPVATGTDCGDEGHASCFTETLVAATQPQPE